MGASTFYCTVYLFMCVLHILEGQCLATVVGGCAGVEDGTAGLGRVTAQGDVSPAAQNVALSAWTPLCCRSNTNKCVVCRVRYCVTSVAQVPVIINVLRMTQIRPLNPPCAASVVYPVCGMLQGLHSVRPSPRAQTLKR